MSKFFSYGESSGRKLSPIHRALDDIVLVYEEKASATLEAFYVLYKQRPKVSVADKLREIDDEAPRVFSEIVAEVAINETKNPWMAARTLEQLDVGKDCQTLVAISMYHSFYELCFDTEDLPPVQQVVEGLFEVVSCSKATEHAAYSLARKCEEFADEDGSSIESDDAYLMHTAQVFVRTLRRRKRWNAVGKSLRASLQEICAEPFTCGTIVPVTGSD